jgi:hypothetical protein
MLYVFSIFVVKNTFNSKREKHLPFSIIRYRLLLTF